jgi:peptidoglycan/xylan/chitin deacetylase (PgdA/CDA1 family)
MNKLTIRQNKGIIANIRNSPLFFIPLLLVGGYVLASFAHSHIMNSAPEQLYQAQASAAINNAPPEWKPNNPYQVISAINVAPSRIYLLNSKNTRDYFTSTGKNYAPMLNQWRHYFDKRRIQFIDIHETDLNRDLKPGILILPSVVALSSGGRTAIRAFEKRGGRVLATWATGARNGKGEWTGYDFLHEQFDIKVSGEIAAQDNEKFLVVSGETPVAFTLPAGYRIWLGLDKIHEFPLRVSGGDNIAGRFMDYARTPGMANKNEAIVYTELGSSRRVYFAFSENSWRFQQADIYRLLDDVLNWLQRRPRVYLANWPYPYRAAQIVEMDTEQDFPNAINFADMLDSHGYQGTFYSLTSLAKKYPDIVERLEHKHEIAYHGDVHDAFKGQPKEIQSKRLDTMQQELRPLATAPSRLRGFRPPYELADQIVETLLFEKGFGHILASPNGTGGMLPYLSPVSPKDFKKGLIVLPRTQRDDMNFSTEGLNSQDMTKIMNEDFEQAYEYGALGVLSVHSQHFEPDSPVAMAMAQFLKHIKASRDKTWVASGGTIESWWRNRSLFKSKLTGGPTKMLLTITVEKPGLHWGPSLVVLNPVRGLHPKIRIHKIGKTQPGAFG